MSIATNDLHRRRYTASPPFPVIPFRQGRIDYDAHAMNVAYLMRNNTLENGRPRVVSVAGTSLIHHIEPEEQTQVFDVTGQVMGEDGVLMSAIVPNPIKTADRLVEEQSKLRRAPDCYLVMPLAGTFSPEGIYDYFMEFGRRHGEEHGARFIYYHRQARDIRRGASAAQRFTAFCRRQGWDERGGRAADDRRRG